MIHPDTLTTALMSATISKVLGNVVRVGYMPGIDEWEAHLVRHSGYAASTIRNYLLDLRGFVRWYERDGATFDAAQIITLDIVRYRDNLKHERKPTTINRVLVSLRAAWTFWGGDNPVLGVRGVRSAKPAPQTITDRQEAALVRAAHARGARDAAIIVLMLHTGMRAGEVCGLEWTHVTLREKSGQINIWGKGGRYREVPLNATVRGALTNWQRVNATSTGPVFPSSKGGPLTPRALGFVVKAVAKAADLPQIHPHTLRHRCAYRLAESTPLHRVAQILGHDNINTTLRYVGASQGDLQAEMERIAWQ